MDITSPLTRLLPIFIALAIATAIEVIAPLRTQSRWVHGRARTNLALIAITLALGVALNFALALGSAYVAERELGALQMLQVGVVPSFILSVLALDLATYAVHRLMHQTPALWRVHLVHHIDPAVDATTAFRQHPLEGILRFSFIAATAWTLGASPAAIAVYRLLGSLNAILEHANIRVPRALDRVLVRFWVTPDMHKVHHSRERRETDSNYANLFSFFDRMFGTYTASSRGPSVSYGLDGYDTADQHSIRAALWLPFRRRVRRQPAASSAARALAGAFVVLGATAILVLCALAPATAAAPAAEVLFVCQNGNVKSVMAAAYFNQVAAERKLPLRAVARGVAPHPPSVPPTIAAGLQADGVDVSTFKPLTVSPREIADASHVVAIGEAELPQAGPASATSIERWMHVPSASADYAAARDALRDQVEDLIERLARDASE